MFKTIHLGLSPNLRTGDSLLAFKLLWQPWRWQTGKEVVELEERFKKKLGVSQAMAFNSGRSAEYVILKSLGIKKGDEVLLQAFTCVAVPNPILWLGAKPVYVDIEADSLTMDPVDLARKITPRSKALVVQHTFGRSAKLEEIRKIAQHHHLLVIEDCAHVIKKNIIGQAVFYSFGRDKVISGVFGGMAILKEKRKRKNEKLRKITEQLSYPGCFWVFQQLLHPVSSPLVLRLYNFFGLGKMILFFLQKLHLLSLPVTEEEKTGNRPKDFPSKMPNVLAILALNQLKNLEEFNKKRRQIAKLYQEKLKNLPVELPFADELPYLRYPLLTEKAEELRRFAKKKEIILGDWYSHVIDPKGVDLEKVEYQQGSCPRAEKLARQIVNLPTYPRMNLADADRVVEVVREFFNS